MKINLYCMECLKGNGIPNFNFKNFDVNDDGSYELECENGHKSITALQNEKFEVLFDMGALALMDGYKQEAVSCLAASLERFHEWCMLVLLINNGVTFEQFEKTWKAVSAQSERQLGAFYFLYLQEFKEEPVFFNSKMDTYRNKDNQKRDVVKFRNDVTHNGYIPKYEQVIEYGEYLLHYMYKILANMKEKYQESITKVSFYRKEKLKQLKNENIISCNMVINTILGLYSGEDNYGTKTFKEALIDLKKNNDMINSKKI